MSTESWTLAYRRKTASTFRRVTNWSGTWDEAATMANRFGELHPELDIWYVPSREAELAGRVVLEDIGNILTYSGKRVHMTETGTLPSELIGVEHVS
jgi:hypothetical protein